MKVNSRGNVHTYVHRVHTTYMHMRLLTSTDHIPPPPQPISLPPRSQSTYPYRLCTYVLDFITYPPFPLRDLLLVYITVSYHTCTLHTTPTTHRQPRHKDMLQITFIFQIQYGYSQLMTFVFLFFSLFSTFDPT